LLEINQSQLNIQPWFFDDGMLTSVKENKTSDFICYPFIKKALVAGRGSRIPKEVRLESALADKIPVYRRAGGGCSVFLDEGSIIVSAAFMAPGFLNISENFNKSVHWLINGLKKTGLKDIYQDGISDLVINNKKFGGTCFQRSKGFASFSASILFSSSTELMERYLHHPPREPDYRQSRSHMEFTTNLNQFFTGFSTVDFSNLLSDNLKAEDLQQA
jgi:lipoate-protein ligase A